MKFRILRPMLRIWRDKGYRPGTLGVSLAVGMVIGFSPTVGLQMIICLICGLLWNRMSDHKLNLPAMLVGSMVVNPITMGPTYYLYYQIGCAVITCDVVMTADSFSSLGSITELGSTIIWAVMLGSVPLMVVGLPLGLYLGRKLELLLEARKVRRQKRRIARTKIGLAAANK